MGKRRVKEEESDIDVSSTDSETEMELGQEQESGVGEGEEEMVNVDFDYFDLNPEVDFHATKTFLRQLFGDDAGKFDISGLADLILKKNSIGTTIKTDGQESDPFSLLTVLNISENIDNPSIKLVIDYILKKTGKNFEFNLALKKLLTKTDGKQPKVGWIISERMINMPVETVPPMYNMLLDEMNKSDDAHENYEFDWFLIISKIYKLVAANTEDSSHAAKKKKLPSQVKEEMDYFHHEDIILEQNCKYHGYFDYTEQKQETDSRRVFTEYGIDPKLSIILIDKSKLAESVPQMQEKFPPF